ncbi:LCP family protein [Brachybacterium phenoliresistens]|uniref:LCP family glycopolymer transferase n=1 Tax=Brachybacterium phenoliresistens TaxID=396014 RepID=UPI001E42476A|nr:LCP family protein [Brachybacterium phenoliresistens]
MPLPPVPDEQPASRPDAAGASSRRAAQTAPQIVPGRPSEATASPASPSAAEPSPVVPTAGAAAMSTRRAFPAAAAGSGAAARSGQDDDAPTRPTPVVPEASATAGRPEASDAAADTAPRPRGRRARELSPEERDAWAVPPPDLAAFASTPEAAAPAPASPEPSESVPASPAPEGSVPTASVPAASAPRPAAGEADDAQPPAQGGPAVAAAAAAAPAPTSAAAASASGAPATGAAASASEEPSGGRLRVPALWTLLSAVVPGAGLIPTRLRRVGILLTAVFVVAAVALGAWLLLADPTRALLSLATDRTFVVALMVVSGLVGVVWVLQIIATNLAHTTRQGLTGAKRGISLVLALVMVIAVALPFGRGVQSLWAAQGLLGNQTVFGGATEDSLDQPDPWAGRGRVNIMLLGQDAGADRTGTRPDTIMVASIDTATGRTALFSIPRNLQYVEFPEGSAAAKEFPDGFDYFGRNENLINAVWTWAEDRPDLYPGDPSPGLTATTQAVSETLGLDIDYYAMVNLQGFEDLVDAIGGVKMEVERRIPIGGGTNQSTGRKYPISGYIEPGWQELDGYTALWYARSREGSDDFNRMCRQQRIVRVVTEEADPATLALSVPGLVTATERNIETNIPSTQLSAFVDLGMRIKKAGFTSYPITTEVTNPGRPDYDYIEQWVQASIEDSMSQVAPESVRGEDPSAEPTAPAEPSAPADSSTATTTPTEEPSAEETTEEQTTTPEDAETSQEATEEPVIVADPLKSCMPGQAEGTG